MMAPALAIHRSRKLIPPFELLRPRTVREAASMQVDAPDHTAFMAGGIDLINRLKFGQPISRVVYLGAVGGLNGIEESATGLTIGAGVTHDQLQTSPVVRARLPALAETWSAVANVRVRLKGTLGGNLMAREPTYDVALAVMAAGAELRFAMADGAERRVAAGALTDAAGRPVAQPGLLTAIALPASNRLRLGFDRSLRPALSMAVGLDLDGTRIAGGRVAIGCAFAGPLARALPFDAPLAASELAGAAGEIAHRLASTLPEPASDGQDGATYRRRMVAVLLRRQLVALAGEVR